MFAALYFSAHYWNARYFAATGADIDVITDTDILQKPVNCVLAGQQPYKFSGREYEIHPSNRREQGRVNRSGVARLRGSRPSFTTKTSSRGYD